VSNSIPIVEASGAADENHNFEISIRKTIVTIIADILCE
jgi:hypothetical protein